MIYSHQIKLIQAEADAALQKLGNGQFSRNPAGDNQTARELVEYRRGLLKAIDILKSKPTTEEDEDAG